MVVATERGVESLAGAGVALSNRCSGNRWGGRRSDGDACRPYRCCCRGGLTGCWRRFSWLCCGLLLPGAACCINGLCIDLLVEKRLLAAHLFHLSLLRLIDFSTNGDSAVFATGFDFKRSFRRSCFGESLPPIKNRDIGRMTSTPRSLKQRAS